MNVIDGLLVFESDHERTISMNAYYAFSESEHGRNWLEEYKLNLLSPKNFTRGTMTSTELAYSAGMDDRIREIIEQVDAYKIYLNQRGNK